MITNYPPVYSLDSNMKVRSWEMEREDNKHRVISGLLEGKKTTSAWKVCKGKNIGKKNETTPEGQAELEVHALYEKKTERGWIYTIPDETYVKRFEPMLALKYKDVKPSFPCDSQPKFDGYRCIANKHGLWTRDGQPFYSVPHIWESIKDLFETFPDMILDGELYNHEFKNDFDSLGSIIKKEKPTPEDLELSRKFIQYHIYDMTDTTDGKLPYISRHILLSTVILKKPRESIVQVETVYCEDQDILDAIYSKYLEDGYEGQMIRDPDSLYEPDKRSKGLLKRKEFSDAEFEIVDILEGEGNWAGYAKSIKIMLPSGETQDATPKGSQEAMRRLLEDKDQYIGKLCTVRYQNLTPKGKLRFPIVTEIDVRDKG